MPNKKLNIKLGFPKTLLLSLIGYCGLAYILYLFREGIFCSNKNAVLVLDFSNNIAYKIILIIFLVIAILTSIHLLIVTFKIKNTACEISGYTDQGASCFFNKKKRGVFHKIWMLYEKTLIEIKPDIYKTCADADLYFNAEDIVNNSFLGLPAFEILKIISGTFIGLGILGTFIGFTNAIPTGMEFNSVEDLKPLLEGLKIAFNTSIFGVLGSVIYNFLIAQPIILSLENNSRELSDLIDAEYYISNAAISQLALLRLDEIIKEGRDEFANKIKSTAETLEKIADVLMKTPEILIETNNQLKASVDNICEKTREQLNLTVDTIRSALTEELTKVNDSFNESATIIKKSCDSINKVPDGIIDVKNELEDVIEQTSNQLQNCYATIEKNITESLDTLLNNVNAKCEDNLNSVTKNIQEIISSSLESTQLKVSQTISNLEKNSKDNIDNLITEIQGIVDQGSNDITNKMSTFLNDLTAQNNEFISSEIKNIHSYAASFEETMQSVWKETESMPEEIEHIYENLHSIPEELKKLQEEFVESTDGVVNSTSLADSINKIKELNTSFKERETGLISLMNKSGEKFANAVSSVEKVSAGLDKILKKMEQAEQKIESSNTAMTIKMNNLLKHKPTEDIIRLLTDILKTLDKNVINNLNVDEKQ